MNQNMPWSHQTRLAADLISASIARDFICLHLGEHDLPHLVDDMRLVVSELATNALRHARTAFTVTLHGNGSSVLLTVQDGSSSLPVQATAGDTETGRRGLSIVDQLSDDWGVTLRHGGAKSVWASFTTRVGVDDPDRM